MNNLFIRHENIISVEELNQMIEDIEIIVYHVEKMNEMLGEKIQNRHPVFCSLVRALLLSNCHAIKATLQIKATLDKTMDDFLEKSESNTTE